MKSTMNKKMRRRNRSWRFASAPLPVLLLATLCFASPATAQHQTAQQEKTKTTLEEILAGYRQAIGADALARIQSVEMRGTFTFNGIEQPFTLYRARPGHYRLEIETQRGLLVQGFDGEAAFASGRRGGVETLEGTDRALAIEEFGDFDGPLVESGDGLELDSLELVGRGEFDGEPVWHLRLHHGGDRVENWYLRADSLLPIKRTLVAEHRRAGAYERSWYLLEYDDFAVPGRGTVKLPVYFEREDRQHVRAFTVEEVIFEPELEAGFFAPPSE